MIFAADLRSNPDTFADLLLNGVSAGVSEQDLANLEGRGPEGGETSGNHFRGCVRKVVGV